MGKLNGKHLQTLAQVCAVTRRIDLLKIHNGVPSSVEVEGRSSLRELVLDSTFTLTAEDVESLNYFGDLCMGWGFAEIVGLETSGSCPDIIDSPPYVKCERVVCKVNLSLRL